MMKKKENRILKKIKKDDIELIVRKDKDWFTRFLTKENWKLYEQSMYNFEKNLCWNRYNLDFEIFMWTQKKENIKRVLVCWHWAWCFTKMLDHQLNWVEIVSIDLNETMIEISKEFFDYSNNVEVILWDALDYLRNTDKKFDIVFYDIYNVQWDESYMIWFENEELLNETSNNLKKVLNDSWILIMNFFQFDFWIIKKNVENWKKFDEWVENLKQIKNLYWVNKKLKELFWEKVHVISNQKWWKDSTTSLMYWDSREMNSEDIIKLNREFWFNEYDERIDSKVIKYLQNEKEITKLLKNFI